MSRLLPRNSRNDCAACDVSPPPSTTNLSATGAPALRFIVLLSTSFVVAVLNAVWNERGQLQVTVHVSARKLPRM